MNHWVPDFDMDEDYSIPTTSSLTRQSGEDEIMELLWQNNAPVAVNPLSECLFPKSPLSSSKSCVTAPPFPLPLDPPPEAASNQLHMAEDEMASWLHYPVEDLYTDLLYPSPISSVPLPPSLARPVPIGARPFSLFSRMRGSASEPLTRLRSGATVVDSTATPIVAASRVAPSCPSGSLEERSASRGVRETGTEGAVEGGIATTSSSSGSGTSSANATATATTPGDMSMRTISSEVVDRKRKSKEIEESFATSTAAPFDPQNEEVELESGDEKKHGRGSSASKRTRAAEVHNLSERRRRDRINERMKALQELIPRCNKSDKASMLNEAIEYLKSLQMQLQMMSTGCGMVPMMYPGMQQQYMPTMGMGMGMDLGMTRPGVPYAPALPTPPTASLMPPALPTTPTASVMPPLAPRMPTAPFAMPLVAAPHHLSVNQPSNLADSTNSPYPIPSPGMGQVPNMVDPYHQYLAYQQMQMQMQAVQGQTSSHPSSSKPTLSKSEGDNEDDIQ